MHAVSRVDRPATLIDADQILLRDERDSGLTWKTLMES